MRAQLRRSAACRAATSGGLCPCCGHLVFDESPGSYDICPVCFWEDDIVQLRWPDWAGGANKPSLLDGQANYQHIDGCEQRRWLTCAPRQPTSRAILAGAGLTWQWITSSPGPCKRRPGRRTGPSCIGGERGSGAEQPMGQEATPTVDRRAPCPRAADRRLGRCIRLVSHGGCSITGHRSASAGTVPVGKTAQRTRTEGSGLGSQAAARMIAGSAGFLPLSAWFFSFCAACGTTLVV